MCLFCIHHQGPRFTDFFWGKGWASLVWWHVKSSMGGVLFFALAGQHRLQMPLWSLIAFRQVWISWSQYALLFHHPNMLVSTFRSSSCIIFNCTCILNVSECCWYDHPLRLEWSRSVGFQSPRWLTQYLRQGCVMINALLSFCPHFAIMLLFYNNKYGLRKYNILPVQHLKDCWCNSHLPKPTRDRQRQFPGWSLRAKTAGGARFPPVRRWVDCRLPREPVNRVWGNIILQMVQSLWTKMSKHVRRFSGIKWYANISLG